MRWYKGIILTVLISALGLSAQNIEAAGAKNGDKVTLEYTGTLSDGTVFDASSKHDTPLEFEVGGGRVIAGFDKAVKGMKLGEAKKFTIQPAEAYGEVNPKLVKIVPRSEIPKDREPKVGMGLIMGTPSGKQMQALITEVTADSITLDLNHPLAGKALTFDIKVVKISN